MRAVVGGAHVLTDADLVAGYATDWTGRFVGHSPCVVRPGSTDEVAAVLRECRAAGVAVVPQGGNTGLVGGATPLEGEVVLLTRRLGRLDAVDRLAAQVTAGAGVTLAALHGHVDAAGLAFGVDLAARDSATIGGMVATNAGGIRVVRHGHMRAQVLGVEAVLSDGRVVSHLGGLAKDNTGYDLAGLLTGSEGTLAVVTSARLRLVPKLDERVVALVAVHSLGAAVELAASLRNELESLDAIEVVAGPGIALVESVFGLRPPFAEAPPVLLLVEAAARTDPSEALAAALNGYDTVVASDAAGRARLWRYREAQTEAIARLGVPHKLDVTLPLSEMTAFAAAVPAVVNDLAPQAQTFLFGHLGDGNLHVNVVGVDPEDERVDDVVLRLVATHSGSISAEHGIGNAKKRWLRLSRSDAEIAAFRAIKAALDPTGTLNPNALFA